MTMLHTLLILIATTQAVPDKRPAPAPPSQDAINHLQGQANYRKMLRLECMSEPGATLVADDWASDRWRDSPAALRRQAARWELVDAATTAPLDQARLERAVSEDAREDARQRTDRAERTIAILRRLSPADQVIFARRLASMPEIGVSCEPGPNASPVESNALRNVVP